MKDKSTTHSNARKHLLVAVFVLVGVLLTFALMNVYQLWSRDYSTAPWRVVTTIVNPLLFVAEDGESELKIDSTRGALPIALDFSSVLKDLAILKEQMRERKTTSFSCPSVQRLKNINAHLDPEMDMSTCEMVRRWGYPCEEHFVQAEGGYILGVHRVPFSPHSNSTPRYPVFLQHGLLSSSADWADNLPDKSLAYILADSGYDVWMGNFRGNTYSRNHTHLDPNLRPFWRFTWDEMAHHDLPAMLHYVLNKTKSADLYYVGHSQGTMTAFAEFTRNVELAHRVRMFFALAPITTVGHITDFLLKTLAPLSHDIKKIAYAAGLSGEFLPEGTSLIDWLNKHVCTNSLTEFLCEDILWVVVGANCDQVNVTRLPVYINHAPAGTSMENLEHFAQMVLSGKYQMYDFGSAEENTKHYNQSTPPLYTVSSLKTPVAVFWGGKDWLADKEDVLGLIEQLEHVDHVKFVDSYDHLSFLWATNAHELIYEDILHLMKEKLRN